MRKSRGFISTGDNDATSESDAGSGGAGGFAGSRLAAEVGGGVHASMDGDVSGGTDSVSVTATGANDAIANALTITVGLVGGAGASSEAIVTSAADVEASIGDTATLTVPGAPITVTATGDNNAEAEANGGAAGLGLAIAAMLPTAEVGWRSASG
ncbi:hypothetical protein [Mangrovicoccus ximenensis]|uniref:hypothetical protein n=1 Tax=Mangrovicoccus ximenensis TaxID=1911570 RepID=UPI000D388FD3|nr:hypothetical protein [Mangrovicoccus ximenensis]